MGTPPEEPPGEPPADVADPDTEPKADEPAPEPVVESAPPPRGRPVRLPQLVIACLLVASVAAVTTLISLKEKADPFAMLRWRPPVPVTVHYPVPESDTIYQATLNTLATGLTATLTELANATTPDAIVAAAQDLDTRLGGVISQLENPAPLDAEVANSYLYNALQRLQDVDLLALRSGAQQHDVCLGAAATSLLSRSTSVAALRDAIAQLTSAPGMRHYQFAATLPPVTQDTARVGTNGAIVAGATGHGLGQLTITNGGTTDATVNLVPAGANAPTVGVYVVHGGNFTLNGIPDGTYQVYLTSGTDWDANARLFSHECTFDRYDDPLAFTTTSTEYTTWTISVTSEPGGTATASTVDPGQFPH